MLVLPVDPGLWSDVISRWESITINRFNSQTWSDNKAKLAFVENLLGEISADFDDSSVYSISEGEGDVHQNICIMVQDTPFEEASFMAIEGINKRSWKPNKELPTQSKSYEHDWKENTVTNYTICINQKRKKTSTRKEELWQSEKSLLVKDLTNALEIIYQLKTEQIRLEEQKDEEIRKLKTQLQKEIEKETEA
ncbi:hypothetical protein Tco_1265813 [Tanacetum coccineum]